MKDLPSGTNLLVSFSGGKTSAYMAIRLKKEFGEHLNLFYVFANTGQEMEQTLEFVNQCDQRFRLGVVWVEAVIDPRKGNGTKHKVVTYETASRKGEPFEDMIKKFGIPNTTAPFCTRELKLRPIHHYSKTLNIDYLTAIGIRADEYRRVSARAKTDGIVYPLLDTWCVDKAQVNDFWGKQLFTLELMEHEGNCSWCWKKSLRKLLRLMRERPELFHFPRRMEELYTNIVPSRGPQVFFREYRTTEDLLELSRKQLSLLDIDVDDGCGESCEMYQTI